MSHPLNLRADARTTHPSTPPNAHHSSFDFIALNLLGWVAYSTFNVVIYFVMECPASKPQLGDAAAAAATTAAATNSVFLGAGPAAAEFVSLGLSSPSSSSHPHVCQHAVDFNDVVFAVHALLVTLLTVLQCCIYPRGKQRLHWATIVGIALIVNVAIAYALAIQYGWSVGGQLQRWMEWVYWLYFLSYVKMGVTLIKYMPQVRTGGGGGFGWLWWWVEIGLVSRAAVPPLARLMKQQGVATCTKTSTIPKTAHPTPHQLPNLRPPSTGAAAAPRAGASSTSSSTSWAASSPSASSCSPATGPPTGAPSPPTRSSSGWPSSPSCLTSSS